MIYDDGSRVSTPPLQVQLEKEGTYRLVLLTVNIGELFTLLTQVLLHSRVHCELLADGVTGQIPDEFVTPLGLLGGIRGALELLVAVIKVLVIVPDGL